MIYDLASRLPRLTASAVLFVVSANTSAQNSTAQKSTQPDSTATSAPEIARQTPLTTSGEAVAAAAQLLGVDTKEVEPKASVVQAASLSDDWFFESLISDKDPAWVITIDKLSLLVREATTEVAEQRTKELAWTVILRKRDGALIGIRTPWPKFEGETLDVREYSHNSLALLLRQEKTEWKDVRSRRTHSLVEVLQLANDMGSGVEQAEQIVVHYIDFRMIDTSPDDKFTFRTEAPRWVVEYRQRLKNGSFWGDLDRRYNLRKKISNVIHQFEEGENGVLRSVASTNEPSPIQVDDAGSTEVPYDVLLKKR